ncbi:LacI family DNA-binding transcriptional regulator [Paenibacillus senegalensis]|uniref:LacI family DNA-binding transcriptional regulator n=1 Tax=Paenibacillus senegalensis TaxID=1465766 RepID=UPI000289DB6E|nr:LacI family DNA-binding transcriptional regulator [Paenibacillus senegalensis]
MKRVPIAMMKPTIKDVAKLAGVSVGTVSKVINHEGTVKPLLQEKVWRAIRELNYRPNAVARSLKSSTTNTLAVLLGDITNPFQMTLAKAIEDVMNEHDYQLLISSTKEDPEMERKKLRMLYEKRVDGIIVCTTGRVNDEIRTLLERQIPIVLVDRPVLSLPADIVADNNRYGMELLTRHLVELGHRRIGVVHGDVSTVHGKIRYDGIVDAFSLYGLALPEEAQYYGNFLFSGGYEAVDYFLNQKEPPTAILSVNNNMTAGIVMACRDRGIRIPQELTLVTYGQLEYQWNLIRPSVTYVSQSPATIGQKAAELILLRLTNRSYSEVSHLFIQPELFVKESSGSPA